MTKENDGWRTRYEATMRAGAAQYQDILDLLDTEGLPAVFTQTGGMNAALEVQLETGQILLITDEDDSLAWTRTEQHGWGVGLYKSADDEDTGPIRFACISDTSTEALRTLISEVLFSDLTPDW